MQYFAKYTYQHIINGILIYPFFFLKLNYFINIH